MNRLVVTANPNAMRAYRLDSQYKKDHFDFEATEIDLPDAAASAREYQNDDHRRNEVANYINDLVATENPDMWSLAAPIGFFANLLPLLNDSAKKCLHGCKTDDLVQVPAKHIAHLFAPVNAAAA